MTGSMYGRGSSTRGPGYRPKIAGRRGRVLTGQPGAAVGSPAGDDVRVAGQVGGTEIGEAGRPGEARTIAPPAAGSVDTTVADGASAPIAPGQEEVVAPAPTTANSSGRAAAVGTALQRCGHGILGRLTRRRDARPASVDPYSGEPEEPTSRRGRLVAVMAAMSILLASAAVVLVIHPGAQRASDRAFVDRGATTDLISQAQTDFCRAVAADGTKIDAWASAARASLTGEALKQFDDYLPTQRKVLQQTQTVASCRAQAVGVHNLSGTGDGSTAVVDVSLLLSQSVNGAADNSGTSANRLTMLRHKDRWLISSVQPI